MSASVAALLGRGRWERGPGGANDGRQLSLLVDRSADLILRFDENLICTYASPAALRIFGRPAQEMVGLAIDDGLTAEDRVILMKAVERARGGRDGSEAVFRTSRRTGDLLWIEGRFSALANDGSLVGVLRDISTRKTAELALRVANAELNKLAGSDGLTELANRRRFDQTLETECRRASRTAGPVSLLLIDVDRFKAFNDRYGHQAGDECLKRIAAAARASIMRPTDLAARFGGEEFAIMLPGSEHDDAAEIAEKLRHAVEALGISHGGDTEGGEVVTVSIGCATVRPTRETLGSAGITLIAEADRALYEAKRLGRNCVMTKAVHSASSPLVGDERRLQLIADYRNAGLTLPSESLHRIARMAAVLLGMPGAFVALLDRDEIALVGHYGLGEVPEGISHALCSQAIGGRSPLVIPDATADPRFRGAGHGFSFMAAAPLLIDDDLKHLGALWVIDRQARPSLDENKRMLLTRLASLAVEDLETRRQRAEASHARIA